VTLALLAGLLLGYSLRWLHESYQHRQRERVLRALGGELPSWEIAARRMEEEAHRMALRCNVLGAADLHQFADIERRRGRKRDRQWT